MRKRLSLILQPVNAYTRFPEYFFFDEAAGASFAEGKSPPWKVLDVGSPKLFGLHLAVALPAEVHLTDLNERELMECRAQWSVLRSGARGNALVERQDARRLTYGEAEFDIAYAMSSVEHMEGGQGDALAMAELWRVLRPFGTLMVSVPFGDRFIEQTRKGFTYSNVPVSKDSAYFFQRIYDADAVRERLIRPLEPGPTSVRCITAHRSGAPWVAKGFHSLRRYLGVVVSGALGFANPVISLLVNRHVEGLAVCGPIAYGPMSTPADIYADAILILRKPGLTA